MRTRSISRPARKSSGHTPRLDTIQMVEKAIKNDKKFYSKNQLWRSLPKQVQYPTFVKILDYLEESNKIMYEKDGTIIWTFADSAAARKSLKESTPL
ncbi:hypothetical protein [Nitrososphaera sp.]|uniref:hypothetical protein n=1 Tax=Nitrososphaera sp. TaxID=1971748 RepID=UPI00183EF6BF|nr:hypothetical protein [Nitrososphaera sp.]NWG36571.1 hypothetical protein [Nitrososphaera sp.]